MPSPALCVVAVAVYLFLLFLLAGVLRTLPINFSCIAGVGVLVSTVCCFCFDPSTFPCVCDVYVISPTALSLHPSYVNLQVYSCDGRQVCIVATGVVGDLCRALEQDILPYCQHIMGWLMVNLEGAEINR